jgi:hypothetical protein
VASTGVGLTVTALVANFPSTYCLLAASVALTGLFSTVTVPSLATLNDFPVGLVSFTAKAPVVSISCFVNPMSLPAAGIRRVQP